MTVQAVLQSVRQRLSEPKSWLKGAPFGRRDERGQVRFFGVPSNCWCLSWSINEALNALPSNDVAWTELRSDVERELLLTLELRGITGYVACHQVNDDQATTHEGLLAWLDETLARLAEAV